MYVPSGQEIHAFVLGPVHVLHVNEHGVHESVELLTKVPSGQTTPEDVIDGRGLHFVSSFESFEKSNLQDLQAPEGEVQFVHPG